MLSYTERKDMTKKQVLLAHKQMIRQDKFDHYASEISRIKELLSIDISMLCYEIDKRKMLKSIYKSIKRK